VCPGESINLQTPYEIPLKDENLVCTVHVASTTPPPLLGAHPCKITYNMGAPRVLGHPSCPDDPRSRAINLLNQHTGDENRFQWNVNTRTPCALRRYLARLLRRVGAILSFASPIKNRHQHHRRRPRNNYYTVNIIINRIIKF